MANENREPFVLDFPNGQRVEDILKKADADYSKAEIDAKMAQQEAEIDAKMASKATMSDVQRETQNLQNQINEIVRAPESGGDVAAEVAQARVDADGVTHATLKARLDADSTKATSEISGISRTIDEIIDVDFVAETLTMTNNKVIAAATGEVTAEESRYGFVSNYVDLTGYSMCKISAQANQGNYIFAFYDSAYNFITGIVSAPGESRTTLTDKIVNIPANARYIALSQRYSDIPATLNKGAASPKGIEDVEERVSTIDRMATLIQVPAHLCQMKIIEYITIQSKATESSGLIIRHSLHKS